MGSGTFLPVESIKGDGIFSSESSIYTYIIVQRSSKLKIYFVVEHVFFVVDL